MEIGSARKQIFWRLSGPSKPIAGSASASTLQTESTVYLYNINTQQIITLLPSRDKIHSNKANIYLHSAPGSTARQLPSTEGKTLIRIVFLFTAQCQLIINYYQSPWLMPNG